MHNLSSYPERLKYLDEFIPVFEEHFEKLHDKNAPKAECVMDASNLAERHHMCKFFNKAVTAALRHVMNRHIDKKRA